MTVSSGSGSSDNETGGNMRITIDNFCENISDSDEHEGRRVVKP